MDGLYPTNYCQKNLGNGMYVSSSFIRNKGQLTFPTLPYDLGFSPIFTNNPPPINVYVRLATNPTTNKTSYWVNGRERPRIVLKKNTKYQFNISTIGIPFYFTKDPIGGNGNNLPLTNVPPTDYNLQTFTFDSKFPEKFYYQSSAIPDIGGEIILNC